MFPGTAWSSSLPSFPPRADGYSVAAGQSVGAAVPLFLRNRSRHLLPPQREPTSQQLQGAARHLEGHHCQPSATMSLLQYEGLHLPRPAPYLFTPPDFRCKFFLSVCQPVTPRPLQPSAGQSLACGYSKSPQIESY